MERNKGWRMRKRFVKATRRMKEDRQQHKPFGRETLEKVCSCFAKLGTPEYGKTFARFADHPKNCNGLCCANPRRVFGHLIIQEQREALDWGDDA